MEAEAISRVAVKVLKEGVTQEVREDFEREVEIMHSFDHDNILRLIGVITKGIVLFISEKSLFTGIHNDFTCETWWQ